MTIETLYVRAASKAAINRTLAAGGQISGTVYTPCGQSSRLLSEMPRGTVVKVFSKYVCGSPYAQSYGTVDHKKDGTLFVR